jgi:hypothetical protein
VNTTDETVGASSAVGAIAELRSNALLWYGVVTAAVGLLGGLQSLLDLSDWARFTVAQWHSWTKVFWNTLYGIFGVRVPDPAIGSLNFIVSLMAISFSVLKTKPTLPGQSKDQKVSKNFFRWLADPDQMAHWSIAAGVSAFALIVLRCSVETVFFGATTSNVFFELPLADKGFGLVGLATMLLSIQIYGIKTGVQFFALSLIIALYFTVLVTQPATAAAAAGDGEIALFRKLVFQLSLAQFPL